MCSSDELSLGFKPCLTSKTIGRFLGEVSTIKDGLEKSSKLNECLNSLEEERKKIDGFKRELPLCMRLLNDAIENLKDEAGQCRSKEEGPVLEEFIPIKRNSDEDGRDKMNWMSSAQLWSCNNTNNEVSNRAMELQKVEEPNRSLTKKPFLESPYRGGAFVPFKGFSGFRARVRQEEKEGEDLPLFSAAVSKSVSTEFGGNIANHSSSSNIESKLQSQQRKARRCWSPELHRRFVNALCQLGGAQVATPKQIRELMKVEGLSNDEVKSHLQKYRLHIQKLPPSASTATKKPVVLLGDIWVSHDQYQASKSSTCQSGSPQGPLHLRVASQGISSTGVDSCGEEDDYETSESYSWKGHHTRLGEDETESHGNCSQKCQNFTDTIQKELKAEYKYMRR